MFMMRFIKKYHLLVIKDMVGIDCHNKFIKELIGSNFGNLFNNEKCRIMDLKALSQII